MERPAISASQLRSEVASKNPPILIDVRRRPTFVSADEMIAGALRREPEQVHRWAQSLPRAGSVVVYCVHGREVSQGVAVALNESGMAAWRRGRQPKARSITSRGTPRRGGSLASAQRSIGSPAPGSSPGSWTWMRSFSTYRLRKCWPRPRKRMLCRMTFRTCISRTTASYAALTLFSSTTA